MTMTRHSTILAAVLFLAWTPQRAVAQTWAAQQPPYGRPDATIDLRTKEGTKLARGVWRYSDARIIDADFRAPGPDLKPTGAPIKTYDYVPHAGAANFDDANWEILDPASLDARRSTGEVCFNWYRINLTIPGKIANFDPTGATVAFEIVVDDY